MNDFEKRWERRKQRWENKMQKHQRHGHIWTGLIILLIGVAALLKAIAFPLPYWLFTWPMLLLIIGFFIGVKCGFRGYSWFFIMLIGGAFLAGYIIPDLQLRKFIWPSVLIIIGLAFILRPHGRNCGSTSKQEKKSSAFSNVEEATVLDETQNSKEDILDTTSIFFFGA